MPRPKKESGERKDYDLRMPLTTAQREQIEEAARLDDQDKATWARAVLLAASKKRISANQKSRSAQK